MSRTTKKVKKYKWILTISFITIIIICIIAGFIVRNNQLQNEMLRKEKFVTESAAKKLFKKLLDENKKPKFSTETDIQGLLEGYLFKYYIVSWKE